MPAICKKTLLSAQWYSKHVWTGKSCSLQLLPRPVFPLKNMHYSSLWKSPALSPATDIRILWENLALPLLDSSKDWTFKTVIDYRSTLPIQELVGFHFTFKLKRIKKTIMFLVVARMLALCGKTFCTCHLLIVAAESGVGWYLERGGVICTRLFYNSLPPFIIK